MEIESPSKPFLGVHFVLYGFDPINEQQVRCKLIDGDGVDVGLYSQSCTHVIVDKIVLDDPVCVAARTDGKTLVTSLWVDHSYDIGMPVDATSIMYRPLRDLNGIPGAKNLVVCLTGYQRQDREDIMTMVGLMGAQFSKPLVANKVTHLICYKFEGEKYELAKKMKKIKLVNHRWLEDCLRDWELLSEAKYDKSGYELEMEAEAKDSEEETEVANLKQFRGRDMNRSPHILKAGIMSECESPKSALDGHKMVLDSTVPEAPSGVDNARNMLLTPGKVSGSHQVSSSENVNVPEANGCQYTVAFRDALHERTPTKVEGDEASALKNAEISPHSGSKFSSTGYSKKTSRKSPLSMSSRKVDNDILGICSAKVDNTEARTATACAETPKRGGVLCHEERSSSILSQKRMSDSPSASSKSHEISCNAKACNLGAPINYKTIILETRSSPCHPLDNHLFPGNNRHYTDEAANLSAALNSHPNVTENNSSIFNKKVLTPHLPFIKSVTSEALQSDSVDRSSSETTFRGSKEPTIGSKPSGDFGTISAHVLQNQHYDIKVSSAISRISDMDKSSICGHIDLLKGGNDKLNAKPVKKKMAAKKTLGSRHTVNQKGSIYSNKVASPNDPKFATTTELETAPLTVSNEDEAAKEMDAEVVAKYGDDNVYNIQTMGDETEAPDEKDENEFEKAINDDKTEVVEFTHEDAMMKRMPGVRHEANDSKDFRHDEISGEKGINTEPDLDESTSKSEGKKRKINKGKERPPGKSNAKTVSADKGMLKAKKDVVGEVIVNGESNEEDMENERRVLHHKSRTCMSTASANKLEASMDVEKENRPVADGGQTLSLGVGKSILKSMKTPMKINKKEKVTSNSKLAGESRKKLKDEPVSFILSGHRLQRKEFQLVIRRLKGRLCRDSHQWSYQATHYIASDPIRRTEKFFAAAASGRWILKTDYLSACSQAGKFLPEEPYEWHKNGLSEDGAINLEAPRKWRVLRERTGHGAFYRMNIIVYGDCIAPPLDTLKRVVKAGDGNILATSPPYTRILKSGVDFAVVSPGMPRVDVWVQEFLKHEIPCVVADYLVEFVCKPGYSLEKHVLYSTHSWAERSFANMLTKAEEIVVDLTPPNGSDDDITCQVCGCSDRGEVMLICGDESGSVGCGVGTHIDCCDPPLENVPKDDWFCPNCTRSTINPSKKRKGARK